MVSKKSKAMQKIVEGLAGKKSKPKSSANEQLVQRLDLVNSTATHVEEKDGQIVIKPNKPKTPVAP